MRARPRYPRQVRGFIGVLWLGSMAGCSLVFPLGLPDGGVADDSSPPDTNPIDMTPTPTIPGLVARYPLDQLDSLQALDVSGNGLHAICNAASCPTPIGDGRHEGALRFDGSQVLRIKNDLAFDLPAFTIATWFRADSITGFHTMLALPLADPKNTSNPWALSQASNIVEFTTAHLDGESYVLESATFEAGTWHHIAASWDGVTKRIALDGAIGNTINPGSPFISGPLAGGAIGADVNGAQAAIHFTGDLDEVQVYDRALDEFELSVLAQ